MLLQNLELLQFIKTGVLANYETEARPSLNCTADTCLTNGNTNALLRPLNAALQSGTYPF